MLEPESRMTLMEAMRPPPGFYLEKAVGTTFSAELETLMLIPLALSSKDGFCDEDGRPNFFALLDSIRRTSRRMVVFCHRGRVLIPKALSKLNAFLNHSLFEVNPAKGSFHPKTWLLHFVNEDGDEVYRFICMSRNITSSRSWDTMIVLEGEQYEEESENSMQLAEYLSWLSRQECLSDEPEKAAIVRGLAEAVRYVWFTDIKPVRECYFDYSRPGTHSKAIDLEWLEGARRLLVLSPFLSQEQIEDLALRLPDANSELILVSSIDSLKALDWSSEALRRYTAYSWDDELTSEPEEITGESEEDDTGSEDAEVSTENEPTKLSGLHAKLYIAESGDKATLLTGSANATNAGFRGHNVEFMTLLKGRKKYLGIDAILGNDETAGSARLRDFLCEFEPPAELPTVDEAQQRLTIDLESVRKALASGEIVINVQKAEQARTFDLNVRFAPSAGESVVLPDGVEGQLWPASLGKSARAVLLAGFIVGEETIYRGVGPGEVSKFIAFELVGRRENVKGANLGFVLGARFEGEPEGLEDMVVASLIDRPDKFYEYLWFLLLTNYVNVPSITPGGGLFGSWKPGKGKGFQATPLFEDLLSRCVEDPGLINDIDSLVTAFTGDDDLGDVIPKEFLRVWAEIKEGLTVTRR